ncbi:hypothetical protein BH10PSE13_BH10PSE13_06200 [soil metagenome]
MSGAVRRYSILRALFGMLVALVLAARLFSPAGFMPVATAHGVMVTLCTGQGAVKMLVARENTPVGHQDDSDSTPREHCPFAGIAAAPTLPAMAPLPLLAVWHLPTGPIAFALKTGWIARIAAPPPPSSGPPATLD